MRGEERLRDAHQQQIADLLRVERRASRIWAGQRIGDQKAADLLRLPDKPLSAIQDLETGLFRFMMGYDPIGSAPF